MIATCLRVSQALRLPVALLLAAIGVGIASLPLTDGESTGHAFSHLIPAAVATLVAGVAVRFWRVRPTRLDRFARRVLGGALSFFAAAQILEAVGAFAWESDGETVRSEPLHTLHDVALVPSTLAFPLVGLSAVVALAALVARVANRGTRHHDPLA